MNREILFRGKRKQDGLWVHGDLVRLKELKEKAEGLENEVDLVK